MAQSKMRSSFLSSKRSLSSSFLLAIWRLNEAVTLRSKQPLIHTYRTKKGSTLTSLLAHALGDPNFPRGSWFWRKLCSGRNLFSGGPNFAWQIEPWRPRRRQNVITALTTLPQGWVSARKHQCTTAITKVWTEFSWAFPESYTGNDSWIVRSSDGGNGETNGLITPQPRWVSEQLLYICVTAR